MSVIASIKQKFQKWWIYAQNVRIGSMNMKTIRTNLKMANVFTAIGTEAKVHL